MAAIYSNGGNRWSILGFNFTKRDALSSLYKISMLVFNESILIPEYLFFSLSKSQQIGSWKVLELENIQLSTNLRLYQH